MRGLRVLLPILACGLLTAALPLLSVAPAVAAETAPGRTLEPVVTTDLLKIRTAGELAVSPDGGRVVYVVTEMGEQAEGGHGTFFHLWLADLEGREPPRRLTHGERRDGSPAWSPDGTRLAFVRSDGDEPQIWILPVAGGEAWVLTRAEHGATAPRWSPDGRRILFASEIPMSNVAEQAGEATLWPSERPGREWGDAPRPPVEEAPGEAKPEARLEGRADGTLEEIRAWLAANAAEGDPRVLTRRDLQGEHDLEPDLSFTHPFVIEASEGAEAVPVAGGYQDFSDARWAPEGDRLVAVSAVYDRHPDRVEESDLWEIPLAGEKGVAPAPRLLLHWPGWRLSAPRFSPDGKTLLFSARDQEDRGYALSRPAVVSAAGGEPRFLAPDLDRDARSARWSRDGRWVYLITPDEGAFPLLRLPAAGGRVERVIDGPRGVRSFDLAADRLVFALTEVKNPCEVYTADPAGRGERRLTALNHEWVSGKRLSVPRERRLKRPGGHRVQSWVMEPATREPGKRYPLVLEIHGGPSAMWGPGELTMWHEFQLLASWGYGVVYGNPRGSGGYGYRFKRANYRDWGPGPTADVLAVLDRALELPWVDRERLVVTGGSYAGYLTAWIVSQDHRFKAAVAQRGVYDLSFFFGEGNAWQLVPRHFGGYPWEEEARGFLDRNSPQTYVESIRTPLLILHSDLDRRTGVNQSEMLYKSLKVLGRPVEYVRYPDEGHDLSRSGDPKRRMDRLNRIVEFFERFLDRPTM